MAKIIIKDTDIKDLAKQQTEASMPKNISQLTNDSAFVTSSGSVQSVDTATNTTDITGASGTSSGSFGAAGNVTLGSSGSASIRVPYFRVNEQGLITQVTNRTLSMTTGCSNCSQCSQYSSCSQCSDCNVCNNCSRTCSNCYECNDSCGCQP